MKRSKTKVIKWCEAELKLRESIRTNFEMSFASPENIQCTPFFHCKDYLQDCIFNCLHNRNSKIYGLSYDPLIHPVLSFDKTKILITNSEEFDLQFKIHNSLDFLNQFEGMIKASKTKIFNCENPTKKYFRSGIWLFEGSCRWMKSPPMISLYALLIRTGINHIKGENFWYTIEKFIETSDQSPDAFRIKQSIDGIKKIIRIGDRKIFCNTIEDNYPVRCKVSEIHNKLGIVSFSQEFAKTLMPYWYRERLL